MINRIFKWMVIAAVVGFVVLVAYAIMTKPDQRSVSEKISDAYHELGKGADKAERQLEDRTPAQKLGDDLKDVGDDVKHDTDQKPTP